MVFSSYIFVFAFLPAVLAGYYALSHVKSPYPQRVFLAAASLFFYAYFTPKYLFIILGSVAANFALAALSLKSRGKGSKRLLLCLAVLFNVLLLGYYKYFDFFIGSVNSLASTQFALRGILLPLGISFFTFQQLSFQLKIYRCEITRLNFITYILFVSFFPQLVAGPIVQYSELVPQIESSQMRRFNAQNFIDGLFMFTLGLSKKVLIADSISVLVDNGFSMSGKLGLFSAWVCALGYTFQIYFDFSGYSDMAIGLGRMFNFELPVNFNSPYKSSSVGEFWKRWHITLGRTLAELIYIPLGGNRRGKARKYLNLFLTFLVSGIWHGAAWTFVAWGAAHGAARVAEEILAKPLKRTPQLIKTASTFLFVCAAFVLFRAESFSQAAGVYKGMFNFSSLGYSQLKSLVYDGIFGVPAIAAAALVAAAVLACFILVFKCKNSAQLRSTFKPTAPRSAALAVMFIISVICMSRSAVFIYFNF